MNYFSSNFKLGVLGGGQLGKMMLYVTRKFDVFTAVLDSNDEAPSKLACNRFVKGDLMSYDAVYNFGKDLDVLTIEIENVNIDALEALAHRGVAVYPQPNVLRLIQNKATQKAFYIKNDIATAAFLKFTDTHKLQLAVKNNEVKMPFVWKAAQFGYDGKGVKVVKTIEDLNVLPNVECIAEDLIPFKNELSVIVARNASGNVKTFAVVEMEFHPEANQVEYVISPARLPEAILKKAETLALKTSAAFNHVGVMAVEMFLTKSNEVLVNEVAPRPHNSGHQTIESSYTCQFEQHIRAILNLPLGETKQKAAGVMVNLVGAEGYSGKVKYKGVDEILSLEGVTPHIYGKKTTHPFRKMGHVTIVNKSVDKARQIAQQVKDIIKVVSYE